MRPFFNWGLLLVVDLAGALAALAAMVVFSFLPFLATVAHVLGGAAVGRAIGQESGAAARLGAVTGSGKGIGVGVSGQGVITHAGIACIIMREVYATMRESIYPNPSSLSRGFPKASGRLLRNPKEFMFQDMAN